jgi:molybdenum cofactor synthesis domain-containing protein
MLPKNVPTAALLIIGNEILSGQTQDQNAHFLAQGLADQGILLREYRTIPDDEEAIIEALNALRQKYTYVFTTGGIGPTHDDITANAVAKAFNRKIERNPKVEAAFISVYPDINSKDDPRLRMADMPEGVTLIANSISTAPGFQVENVFVLAGVPDIMQGMFNNLVPQLQKGPPLFTLTVFCKIFESRIAIKLGSIQNAYPDVEIGSYPSWKQEEEQGVKLVFKGFNAGEVEKAFEELIKYAHESAISTRTL